MSLMLPVSTPSGPEMRATRLVSGILCREGTYDDTIARQVSRDYAGLPMADRVVLDVGANVGAFSRWALDSGARLVVAVEPEPSNLECLRANLASDVASGRALIIEGCLDLADGDGEIFLSASGKNPGNTSQTPRRGRFARSVRTHSIATIMSLYRPESVKLDCEGAEYVCGRAALMPAHVRDVAAEVHVSGFGLETARLFCSEYEQGWQVRIAPRLTETTWHTIGAWAR